MANASGATRISALDGLRGFAVLAVLFAHTIAVPISGHIGVDIFFTLSGFLISSQLYDELDRTSSIDLARFYWKRCVRLLPAFFALVAFYYLLTYAIPSPVWVDGLFKVITLPLVANYYWATHQGGVIYLSHTWTLAVEWQFYLLWPALLVVLFKMGISKGALVVGLAAAVIVIWALRWTGHDYFKFDGILIGAMVPLIQSRLKMSRAVARSLLPVSLAVLVLLVFHSNRILDLESEAAGSVLTAFIILSLAQNKNTALEAALENNVLRHFGKISYGLYLYHFPIVGIMFVNGFKPLPIMIVGLVVSIPLADVSWRYLEEPLIKSLRWRVKARVTEPA
jgi:peptidoglycan/LPS O-acetylase OafA/YrhL